jgi:hypothetical protein
LWTRLKGWSQMRSIARLMWKYLWFREVLPRPSYLHICLIIMVMALWNFKDE